MKNVHSGRPDTQHKFARCTRLRKLFQADVGIMHACKDEEPKTNSGSSSQLLCWQTLLASWVNGMLTARKHASRQVEQGTWNSIPSWRPLTTYRTYALCLCLDRLARRLAPSTWWAHVQLFLLFDLRQQPYPNVPRHTNAGCIDGVTVKTSTTSSKCAHLSKYGKGKLT
jgi:hypothetical protein